MEDGKVVYADVLSIKKPGWENGRAYAMFADSLWAICVSYGVQHLAVEMKIPKGQIASSANTHDIASVLYGRCEEIAHRLTIPLTGVAIQSWRSVFLRGVSVKAPPKPWFESEAGKSLSDDQYKSRATTWRRKEWKRHALEEAKRRGVNVKSHDAAEAVGICQWLWAQLHPLGLAGANDLFELPKTTLGRPTISLPQAKSEAERVFSRFNADTAE